MKQSSGHGKKAHWARLLAAHEREHQHPCKRPGTVMYTGNSSTKDREMNPKRSRASRPGTNKNVGLSETHT